MYKVCLVEDEPDSRELLGDCVRSCKRLQLMGAYSTAEEALREVPRVKPDVILMDIILPGISGIDCLIALRELIPPCTASVVMLTAYEDGTLIFHALQAGAEGYLLKRHASARELEAAIVEVMAGGRPFDRIAAQTVTAFFRTWPSFPGLDGVRLSPGAATSADRVALEHFQAIATSSVSAPGDGLTPVQQFKARILTPCEEAVLKFVALGLTYKEVADRLKISVDTVGKHLQSIFHKLDIHSRTDPRLYAAASSLGQNRCRSVS